MAINLKSRDKKSSNGMSIRTISSHESDIDGIQMIEEIDGFVSIEMIKRTRVMNNDILIEILSNLSFKSLLKSERLSKQFGFCSGFVLQNVIGIEGKQFIDNECEDSRH